MMKQIMLSTSLSMMISLTGTAFCQQELSTATVDGATTGSATVVPRIEGTPIPANTGEPTTATIQSPNSQPSVVTAGSGKISIPHDTSVGMNMEILPSSVRAGEQISAKLNLVNAGGAEDYSCGLSLGFDPGILKIERIDLAQGTQLESQTIRDVNPERQVLRLRFQHQGKVSTGSGSLATILFTAIAPGETLLEPLSIQADARDGRTFVKIGSKVMAPEIRPRQVIVK
jgi:hypothetical protein